MSFRKRNVAIADSRTAQLSAQPAQPSSRPATKPPGTRFSTVDGRLVTSTGTATLDSLFAGHGGLCLGTSLLIEENGTTEYAGALLRIYAAEGLLQGHHVHVVGMPETWGRELPGPSAEKKDKAKEIAQETEKMKIAWRYEKLGQQDVIARDRTQTAPTENSFISNHQETPFSHSFDLTKRLSHPPSSQIDFINLDPSPFKNPFSPVLSSLTTALSSSPAGTIHRIIMPNLLSPAFYPPHSTNPAFLLQAIHGLRALLATHSSALTIIMSLPTSLHPRPSGLTRWLEILSDGVLELIPFPHSSDAEFAVARDPNTKEEPPQGLLRVHKIPVFHELGSGSPPSDTDWTFTMSRRKFAIKSFNLPPIEGDTEAQQQQSAAVSGDGGGGSAGGSNPKPTKKVDLEF